MSAPEAFAAGTDVNYRERLPAKNKFSLDFSKKKYFADHCPGFIKEVEIEKRPSHIGGVFRDAE